MRFAALSLALAAGALATPSVAYAQSGGAFNAGAAQVPPRGTYDHYHGPGATVLKRGRAAQDEPGVAEELAPDAKQTATGGPVGGSPSSGSGR